MTFDFSQRKSGAPIVWSASLFAAAYWLLDAGNSLWTTESSVAGALLPVGSQFFSRLLFAAVFAIAGSIAGAALQRGRDVQNVALDKLGESDRKYHALLASSFDSVLTLDAQARIEEISESAAALFDSTPHDMIGRGIDDLFTIDSGSDAKSKTLSRTLGTAVNRQDAALQVTAEGQHGRKFPAEVRVTPVPGNGNCAWVLAVRETTTSIVAQKALQHSERRYRALFDNILDGVYRSLPDGRLLAANASMARLLGYESVDSLLERGNVRDFYRDPQQRNRMITALETHGQVRNLEIPIKRHDGTTVTVLANVRAVYSDNNDDAVYEGTLTDITDILEARDALADSNEQFRTLVENSLDLINVIDSEGRILYSSPAAAEFSGRAQDEQVGIIAFRNAHPDDIAGIRQVIEEGFARPGTPQRFVCRIFNRSGELRYIESVGTAFLTRHGEVRAVINSRDISERMETEAQLREMQKLQVVGRLTDGLAHDFNNLLTVLSGNLEMLDDRIEDALLRPHLTSAMAACQQGCDLTRRLMAFADYRDARPVPVNVNALVLDIEPVMRRSLSESIGITIDPGEDLWDVTIDPSQFEGVLLQLAVNANDALKDDGTLTISTRNLPAGSRPEDTVLAELGTDCVSVCVSDTGHGMDESVLARATEPFFSTSEGGAHSGLGLSAVKNFAEAAGGRLALQSSPGQGTAVCVYLPRAAADDNSKRARYAAPRGEERVLVVDDNVDVRNATTALLSSLGYEVIQAGGGVEALELMQNEDVDLLFTDLAMPKMNGMELAARARARHPNLKVLLTSGNEAATAEAHERLNPHYELIRKPFRKQRLAEHVRHVLDTEL